MSRKSRPSVVAEWIPLLLVAVPVVGVFMGGLYSLPVMSLTRGKEPYITLSLCACLALPAVAVGHLFDTPPTWRGVLLLCSVLLLLAQRLRGPLDRNVERFGVVHGLALGSAFLIGILGRKLTGARP